MSVVCLINAKGIRIATSTSKIKKIIVTMKNRREKGIRAFLKGSNPHSKGVNFSRSLSDFLPRHKAKAAKAMGIINDKENNARRLINSLS